MTLADHFVGIQDRAENTNSASARFMFSPSVLPRTTSAEREGVEDGGGGEFVTPDGVV